MQACIVIPARYASIRYPGKPLARLRGASGVSRTLIERSVMAARAASRGAIPVFVATDDARIEAEVRRIGADVIMTPTSCRNGTERVAEAVRRAGISADIIVNLQGDAPLTPPHFVTELIEAMASETECGMATPCLRCDAEAVRNLLADRRAGRVGATTVVSDRNGQALYFSKGMIPFMNEDGTGNTASIYHHVGVYAYRREALAAYSDWEPGPLEAQEGLEQLRFLENGHPIRMVEVTAPGAVFWELNNPSDIALIEGYLARMGWE